MRLPLTLSLHVPNFDFPGTEPDRLFETLVEIATTAEASGWSGLTMMDHVHQISAVGPRTNRMLEGNVASRRSPGAPSGCSSGSWSAA